MILVTGASGFIGRRTCSHLAEHGFTVRAAVRDRVRAEGLPAEIVTINGGARPGSWKNALRGVDAVLHLAARVHVMNETAAESLSEFRKVNVEVTSALAQAAAAEGVGRFVFVSSVKVNGDQTANAPFRPESVSQPQDAYGLSKWEAERELWRLAERSRLQVCIVRPPLVYGAGVAGNFLRLLRLVERGIPLPLGGVKNLRSMIYNGNLASALTTCLVHPAAAARTFLVSDGEDLSTPELITRLAEHLGTRARLVPFPPRLLRLVGGLARKQSEIDRVIGSLVVDISTFRETVGWSPPYDVAAGLRDTTDWFRRARAERHV